MRVKLQQQRAMKERVYSFMTDIGTLIKEFQYEKKEKILLN